MTAFKPGDVVSYIDMCQEEGVNLQRGMNYRLHGARTIILMSLRRGAPYADRVEDDGRVLVYEGHDVPRRVGAPDPKSVDQPMRNPNRTLTQNGLFFQAASEFKAGDREAESVRVYEKIHSGIWTYNGVFRLTDAYPGKSGQRKVFKFRLELAHQAGPTRVELVQVSNDRVIPSSVKMEVWKRDKGRCVKCGKADNLHFDHIIPYSKGGSSLTAKNIQLLCARHNLEKRDRIE
jgi:hypothetical protein